MTAHTPAALNIARIIMNGRDRIDTLRGPKSLEGIADLVDGETHVPELLAAAEAMLEAKIAAEPWLEVSHEFINAVRDLSKAVAKAKGG